MGMYPTPLSDLFEMSHPKIGSRIQLIYRQYPWEGLHNSTD